jgi:hypothetical protein
MTRTEQQKDSYVKIYARGDEDFELIKEDLVAEIESLGQTVLRDTRIAYQMIHPEALGVDKLLLGDQKYVAQVVAEVNLRCRTEYNYRDCYDLMTFSAGDEQGTFKEILTHLKSSLDWAREWHDFVGEAFDLR